MQEAALFVTLAGVAGLGILFLWVGTRSAESDGEGTPSSDPGRLRTRLFALLAVAFVPLTAWSLTRLPYGASAGGASDVVVDVVGHQWYWEVSETEVPARRPVLFRVTSADVNHGFAVYDADLRIVAQTQAMPGYVNVLEVVFDEPGEYRILCLEYCGTVHHGMAVSLVAVEEP
jgi:cytochrome c oxidase subunit 2